MKIALLCNNRMAMPAMQQMVSMGVLCGVATADKDPEIVTTFGGAASAYGLPYTTITFKDRAAQLQQWLEQLKPDAVFVMTFPWLIEADILKLAQHGFVNFHYGLLPQMRGADPIFESIRQQLKTAGLTVHKMDAGFDTGEIIKRIEIPLSPDWTYGMLCSQMARLGSEICGELVNQLATGVIPAAEQQDEAEANYWPKVGMDAITINWSKMERDEILALIRACNPIAPRGVFVNLNGWEFGVCDASAIELQGDATNILPGTIITTDPQNGLIVCCRNGKAIRLDVIATGEGIFPGYKLAFWNIQPGHVFK